MPGGRGWIWGGCSDNVDFGDRISKQYVDAFETGQDARAAVNLHNNAAGRLVSLNTFTANRQAVSAWSNGPAQLIDFPIQTHLVQLVFEEGTLLAYNDLMLKYVSLQAVKATMKRICRCHGMSESCALQTCWMQLSDFREVGDYLKLKHDQAHKLELDKRRVRAGNNADPRGAVADALGAISRSELIYLEDSPDYCAKNASLGLQGTEGRECVQNGDGLSQWEKRSCRRLCHECGLRVEERRTETVSSCNCKFHWCCTVKCERCSQVKVKHVCARRQSTHGQNRRRPRGPKWPEFSVDLKQWPALYCNISNF